MKTSLLEWALKLAGMGFVFLAPIIHLTREFSTVEVVETTKNSMPIPILLIVTPMIIVVIAMIFSQVMNAIKDNPFGYGSILFFGVFMFAIAFLGNMWLSKVADLVDYNSTMFLQDVLVYKSAIARVMLYILIGLGLASAGYTVKLRK